MSRLEIVEVSMVGKHFLYQNKSENHAMLRAQAFDIHWTYHLEDSDQYCDYFCMEI